MESAMTEARLHLFGAWAAGMFVLSLVYVTAVAYLLKSHVDKVVNKLEEMLNGEGE